MHIPFKFQLIRFYAHSLCSIGDIKISSKCLCKAWFEIRLLFHHGLQHLRLEENPILEMQHVEAAAILLGGPTLKKFNDKGEKLRVYSCSLSLIYHHRKHLNT